MEELFPAPSKLQNYRATKRPVNFDDKLSLFRDLTQLGSYTAMHWYLSPEPPAAETGVPLVEDVLNSQDYLQASDKDQWLRRALLVDKEGAALVRTVTVGQRDNSLWGAHRKYRITASNFGVVISSIKRNRFPPSLFKRLTNTYDLSKKDAIIWGTVNEQVAICKYTDGGAEVEPTGLWLHTSGALGASPDAIIRVPLASGFHHQDSMQPNRQDLPEILEVKCPFAARDKTVDEAIQEVPDFCLERKDGCVRLKPDHDYYHQVQGQLHICEKSACDLLVWTPKDYVVIRIQRDTDWLPNLDHLLNFYFQRFIMHVLSLSC